MTAAYLSRPLVAGLLLATSLAPVQAQSWLGGQPQQQQPMQQGSASDLGLRLNQLENQMRQMNGRIEQLEHQNRQLQEQVGRGGGAGGSAAPSAAPQRSGQAAPPPPVPPQNSSAGSGPGAPPQNLGTLPGGGATGGSGPLVLAPPTVAGASGGDVRDTPGGVAPIAAPTNSPDDEYALATGFLQRKDYDLAEVSFRQFTESHPQDRRVGDALYGLGESFYQRGQHRDAIEPFLTVVTDHAGSARAPESLLRLGQSLAQIGEKENACATFGEIEKKYPRATNTKAQGARERQRLGC
jgi:tol-pal system protein YbgF